MVYSVKGNLLDAETDYICHQVNCRGKMGSGIAKQIRTRWSAVYDLYMKEVNENMLGKIQIVYIQQNPNKVLGVINMFSQKDYGYNGDLYTNYDAFLNCILEIKEKIPKGASIGFPDHIGCGLGGGDWNIIKRMIVENLGNSHEVYIYKLED